MKLRPEERLLKAVEKAARAWRMGSTTERGRRAKDDALYIALDEWLEAMDAADRAVENVIVERSKVKP